MGWTSSQVLHTDLCKIIQNSYFMDKSVPISLIDTQPFFNFNLMREYFIWRFKNYNSSDVPRCRFLIFNKFYQLIYDAGGWVGRSNFINGRSHKTIIEKVGRGGGEGVIDMKIEGGGSNHTADWVELHRKNYTPIFVKLFKTAILWNIYKRLLISERTWRSFNTTKIWTRDVH